MTTQNEKYEILLNMLDEGLTMLHLDSRHDEVVIPQFLKDGQGGFHPGAMQLNFSWRFGLIDMEVTEDYIEGSLSFQGEPSFCHIPLQFIWGLSHPYDDTGKVVFFEEDCPKDILRGVPFRKRISPSEVMERWEEEIEPPKKTRPPFLKVIKGGRDS